MFGHLKGTDKQPTQEIAQSSRRSIKESSRRLQTECFEVLDRWSFFTSAANSTPHIHLAADL
jgi:hypothetical protein